MSQRSTLVSETELELWGGVECTVNRVGNAFFDQMELSGHASRPADLERFAELGVRTLRYPLLWERTAPQSLAEIDWRWNDERMERLRRLGIRPIVGLVHHGSGPRYTNLADPGFPEKFAAYAGLVAERYPWVDAFTPINEPLTTARFSGLYGLWFPHGRDEFTFAKIFFHQCRAVVLGMEAIRRYIPHAQLVQTEDLGKVFSTPALRYQAEFENHRRWLTWDLLAGRVDAKHPLWRYFTWCGISESELAFFLEHACPADIIGINHYLTSCRFLDEDPTRYPPHTHGGNHRQRYADVEAVRVGDYADLEPAVILREAWARYHTPLAITEAHVGCTREEQLRWLKELWTAAKSVRTEGVPVVAVTAWALLGSYNWNNLVTRLDGHYEPGVFCLRGADPRPTAIARLAQSLVHAGDLPDLPVFDGDGWWRREDRLFHPRPPQTAVAAATARHARELLIIGAHGTLGRAFARICEGRGLAYRLVGRAELDIASRASVAKALAEIRPWAVINAAGYVRVDDAETDRDRCFRENVDGATVLAEECAAAGCRLVTFSSDLVFDGAQSSPYTESCPVSPLSVYGRSKAEAERGVLAANPATLVIRTSAFFGPWDPHNFVTTALQKIRKDEPVIAAGDAVVSPTYVPHLVQTVLDLLVDDERGIWHVSNAGFVTWAGLAAAIGALVGKGDTLVRPTPARAMAWRAPRPAFSALTSERSNFLPPWQDALSEYWQAIGMA